MKTILNITFFLFLIFFNTLVLAKENHYSNQKPSKTTSYSINLTQEEKEWLKKHPVIKIGIDDKWAPIEFVDQKGVYQGLAADYYQKLEEILGVKFEVNTPKKNWADILESVEKRELDLISCAVSTKPREKYATFTKPFLVFPLSIVTQNNVNYIRNLNEIGDKKVVVVKNYASAYYIKKHHPTLKLMEVDNIEKALFQLSIGEAYCYVGILPSVSYYIKKLGYSHLKFSGEIETTYDLAIGVRNDWPELVSILNKALDTIPLQEQNEFYNKWIQLTYVKPIFEEYLMYGVMFLVLLIFMILYKYLLNKKYSDLLEEKNKELEKISFIDTLTKIYNRRKIEHIFHKEKLRKGRVDFELIVVMIDIDFFKNVNDTYGHKIGDNVLIEFAELLSSNIRKTDYIGRYGGEEFLLLCPDTDINGAKKLVENLLNIISTHQFTDQKLHLTASFGVTALKTQESEEDTIIRADKALYISKEAGRDRMTLL